MTRTTTGERLAKLETGMDYLTEKIDAIADSLDKHIDREELKYASFEKKFAAKWVEKAVYSAVGIVIALVITAGFNVLLR